MTTVEDAVAPVERLAGWKQLLAPLRGGFLAKTLTLVLGTGLSQGITVLTLPVLTRLYTPEQFGVYSIYFVIVTTAALVACLCYEPAIMLPEQEHQAIALLLSALMIAAGAAGLTAIVLLAAGGWIVSVARTPELYAVVSWIPLTIFLLGATQALTYWATRLGRFRSISVSRICQTAVTAAGQIGAGLVAARVSGLVVGYLVGLAAGTAVLTLTAFVPVSRFVMHARYRLSQYRALLYAYRDFPLYSTWGDLMNALGFQIIPVALLRLFGAVAAGLYFLAYRVISLPLSLVGASIRQVVLQQAAAELAKGNSISRLVERVIGRAAVFMGLPWLLLALIAPQAFAIIFGARWAAAGAYVRVLAPLGFLQLVTSPISVVLITLQKQRLVAIIQAALLAIAFGSLALGHVVSSSAMTVLTIYTAAQCGLYLVYLGIIVRESSASYRAILREALFLEAA